MKTKFITVLFFFFMAAAPLQGEVTGYLSVDYWNSQEEGRFPNGSFSNPVLGLIFSGEVSSNINYAAEFRVQGDSQIEIDQAWLGFGSSDTFQLKLGLYLVPFGQYNRLYRPHQTLLIHPPLNVDFSYPSPWKDIGVLIEGTFSGFFYSAYLGNGLQEGENLQTGQPFQDNNADKGKGGRIGFNLSQGFEVAYSIYSGKYDDENARGQLFHGIDLTWVTENWHILAEYNKGNLKNPEGFSDGDVEGYFVQVSMNFGNFRPLASYQKLSYEDEFHGWGFSGGSQPGDGIFIDRNRWGLGIVYFPVESVFIKCEYDFNREDDQEKKDNLMTFQIAFSF